MPPTSKYGQIRDLCARFDVEFELAHDRVTGLIYYHFGSVVWQVPIGQEFNDKAYYEVSLQLAATYPDKVLWKK